MDVLRCVLGMQVLLSESMVVAYYGAIVECIKFMTVVVLGCSEIMELTSRHINAVNLNLAHRGGT